MKGCGVFIPSAAFVGEDDGAALAQLRLGEISPLAPREDMISQPMWEVTALCTLAALACFIGFILVTNSQSLCLGHERGGKPHRPTCQSGVATTAHRD